MKLCILKNYQCQSVRLIVLFLVWFEECSGQVPRSSSKPALVLSRDETKDSVGDSSLPWSFGPTTTNRNRNNNNQDPKQRIPDLGFTSFNNNNNNNRPGQTPNFQFVGGATRPNFNFYENARNTFIKGPRYFVVASKVVRPGQVYRVAVTLFQKQVQHQEIEVRASLFRNGVDIGSDKKICQPNIPETLIIRVPGTSIDGNYRLRVEGNDNGLVGGIAFVKETQLTFSGRFMTIFIQTDKPIYMQGQTVRFRAIPINTALTAFQDAMDVYMLDPKGNVVRRWLSQTSNSGAVSLSYQLADQPIFGKYTIRVQALQQIEEKQFLVEEYYQTRFEVNVTMPAFAFDTDQYLRGEIVASYTHAGPVRGNLSITAIIKPIIIAGRPFPAVRTSLFDQYPRLHIYEPKQFINIPSWYRSLVAFFGFSDPAGFWGNATHL